jgi:hypothetical protein
MRTKITNKNELAVRLAKVNELTPYFRGRMIEEGYVNETPAKVKGMGRGAPRKVYKLTKKGQAMVNFNMPKDEAAA